MGSVEALDARLFDETVAAIALFAGRPHARHARPAGSHRTGPGCRSGHRGRRRSRTGVASGEDGNCTP
jgi:hypothetical protein